MITKSRGLIIYMILLVVLALLFAPHIWNLVNGLVLEPTIELWQLINQFIRLIPQTYYWLFIVGCFGVMTVIFLIGSSRNPHRSATEFSQTKGPIKSLADYYSLSEDSYYFKWIIANRLAQITQEIVSINEGVSNNTKELIIETEFPEQVKNYLIAGSDNAHMSDKPKKFRFRKKEEKPLDIDINEVINAIESKME